MGTKTIFSRCKCCSPKIRKLISSWTKNEGWTFDDFATFLELAGINTPVHLSNLVKDKNSFTCTTSDKKILTISLFFGDWLDYCSELRVTEGIETKGYECNSKTDNCPQPQVTYKSRNLETDDKSLHSYYCEYFCHQTLNFNTNHTLKIEFDEPNKYRNNKSDIHVLAYANTIEDYLFNLDNSVSISEVYEKMVSLLSLTDEDIRNSEKISISHTRGDGKDNETEQELAKILVLKGNVEEYSVREGDEFFHLFKDHSWKYALNNTKIIYNSAKDKYDFSVTGTDTAMDTVNIADTLKQVKEKVSKLWKFFN